MSPAVPAPLPLHFAAAEPGPRDRGTALVRLIMIIPQVIVLFFVHIAAFFVAVIGWFGALFTGQLPEFAEKFLCGVVRWDMRVSAYLYFLTDQYPPFSLDEEPGYPIQVAIPAPVPLNRLAVLFRIFIAIPGGLLASFIAYGLMVFSIGSWFMIVVTGAMPKPLFEVTRAVIRYHARYLGYLLMLTPEYPWGLYGDPQEATAESSGGWALRLSPGARSAMSVLIVVGVVLEIIYQAG